MSAVKKELGDKFWVIGVPPAVFSDDPLVSLKSEFEAIFRSYNEDVQFNYMKTLNRVLVTYPDEEIGLRALQALKGTEFHGSDLKVRSIKPVTIGDRRLSLPARTNQFLISPPASPPVGWEPSEEASPVVDYNLLAALSRLKPSGQAHEVISGTQRSPSIVVVDCGDGESGRSEARPRISSLSAVDTHTSRPLQ